MIFYKNFTNHRGCDQWRVVPDQERLIKGGGGARRQKWEGGGISACMVDSWLPVFPSRFFIVLNLVFSENTREIRERGQGGKK